MAERVFQCSPFAKGLTLTFLIIIIVVLYGTVENLAIFSVFVGVASTIVYMTFRIKLIGYENTCVHQKLLSKLTFSYEDVQAIQTVVRRRQSSSKSSAPKTVYTFHLLDENEQVITSIDLHPIGRKPLSGFFQWIEEKQPNINFDKTAEKLKDKGRLPLFPPLF
ncbi:hypothetical protein B0H94_1215 [Salsuginibacillus halophilus]|uniref:Uncharacterized protein n=1 Tax=Salsuginibacillus halophilus TaxID=517424 RepID=A0A2P8H3S0_9BACI|nr:hypothetical protein [Salsuginibacillus halophilus]PSL40840.1 hypothetical protein B0H94_1215 [Salsuginibacillus halophilus]